MNNTRKTIMAAFAVAVIACTLFSQQAGAIPITGKVDFSGIVSTDTGNVNTATSFNNFQFVTVFNAPPATPTGSYTGTGGASVTMNNFSFSPFVAPVPNLWSFVVGAFTYSFNLTSITSVTQPGNNTLSVVGNGTAFITGVGSPYDVGGTQGQFFITLQGPNAAAFSFSATTAALPDGGSALALLGIGLVAVEVLRRKLATA